MESKEDYVFLIIMIQQQDPQCIRTEKRKKEDLPTKFTQMHQTVSLIVDSLIQF